MYTIDKLNLDNCQAVDQPFTPSEITGVTWKIIYQRFDLVTRDMVLTVMHTANNFHQVRDFAFLVPEEVTNMGIEGMYNLMLSLPEYSASKLA